MPRRNVYSHYLPLRKHARTSSRAARESARSPTKETQTRNNSSNNSNGGRASSQSQTSKRRSTLNSREAGYDEAEALRRAIEASKEEAEQANRRPKRGRSDSQEYAFRGRPVRSAGANVSLGNRTTRGNELTHDRFPLLQTQKLRSLTMEERSPATASRSRAAALLLETSAMRSLPRRKRRNVRLRPTTLRTIRRTTNRIAGELRVSISFP